MEFFLSLGPRAGLLAIAVATLIWSAVCVCSFEFARTYRSYDYRGFFRHLLGRGWFLYEICYIVQLMIVLAVIAAAAGAILRETFGISYAVGVLGMMAAVGVLVFRGTTVIEAFLSAWSFVLYAVFVAFFAWCYARFGPQILAALDVPAEGAAWIVGGVKYAAYNLAIIPAILFCVRHVETRRQAIGAGLLAGPIAIIPGLLFYIAMTGFYPQILDRPVPANFLLETLGSRPFQYVFQITLFGTLIETGTGMIHAVNERIAAVYRERGQAMPGLLRPATAVVLLVLGTALARFGLIHLIARGYGTLTWFFLVIFVIPILTLGVWKTARPVV